MNLQLRYYDDPILRQHSEPVEEITEEIKTLAHEMIKYIDNNNGIGLSAVQIGRPIRLFVLRNYVVMPDGRWSIAFPQVFINPKILSVSKEKEFDTEGCMSLPGLQVYVERPIKVKIEATDLDGKQFVEELEGINARVRLHENDHLNGTLHIDRAHSKERKRLEPELLALKKKYKNK